MSADQVLGVYLLSISGVIALVLLGRWIYRRSNNRIRHEAEFREKHPTLGPQRRQHLV